MKLSRRAINIVQNNRGLDTREEIIEAIKSGRLLKLRNCGVITYNDFVEAVGLKEYRLKPGANIGRILWKLEM